MDFKLWDYLIMFIPEMCHGSSLLEDFFAGKAFQEVKEKPACTDAKTIETGTGGLHQAQCCLVSSWYRTTRNDVLYFHGFLAFCFFHLLLFCRDVFVIALGLPLFLYSQKLYRSWRKFRSKWAPSMLSWKIAEEEPKKCNRLHVFWCFFLTGVRLWMFFIRTKLTGGFIFFIFTSTWGNDPIWPAYFSDGLVQPPTGKLKVVQTALLLCTKTHSKTNGWNL